MDIGPTVRQGSTNIRHNLKRESRCRMSRPTIETVPQMIVVYYPIGPGPAPMDYNKTDTKRALARWRLGLSDSAFEGVQRTCIKHVPDNTLLSWRTTGTDEPSFEEGLRVLSITKVQPNGEKRESDANIWQSHAGGDVLDSSNPALIEV